MITRFTKLLNINSQFLTDLTNDHFVIQDCCNYVVNLFNLFMTSKNETTDLPILEYKVLQNVLKFLK